MKKNQRPNNRSVSKRLLLAAGGLLLFAIVAVAILVSRAVSSPQVDTIPISDLLNRADRHEIRQVQISGNVLTAVDQSGAQLRAIKEDQAPIADVLRRDGVEVTVKSQSEEAPLAPLAAVLPVAAVIAFVVVALRKGGLNSQAFSFGRSNARLMNGQFPSVTFKDVAGVEEAKAELSELVQFLKHPEKFRSLGARTPKGVLLVGPPGTGKTLISRAVAGEAGVPFFSVSGSEFVEMFVGVGASRVRDLFRQARKHAPCIVFIDEIDAVGRHRGTSIAGNDEREQTLNQLLVEMDGFDSSAGIIVIAATNRPDILDHALLRPGRFDRRVTLDAPDISGRLAILQVHARGKPLAEGVDLTRIARQTPGFSGADLENLINEAAILAARADRPAIGVEELEEGILRVIAGPERKSRVISDYEKSIIAYHEVGHALVMKAQRHANPVQKVSIISRGQALGLTVQVPDEDSYLTSRAQLQAQVASLLGGRVAEEIIFGDVTTGARQDLASATDIARRMVVELGMSDLGIVPGGRRDEPGAGPAMGEELASRVDAAVKALLDEAAARARSILTERRDRLVAVAEHLQVVETIDAEELDELLGPDWVCVDADEGRETRVSGVGA